MAMRLKLKRFEATRINYQYVGAVRLRVEASDPSNSGMPAEVFLYHRKPFNPYSQSYDDVCVAVCSPADISAYPVGAPDPDAQYPYFRQAHLEFDLRAHSYLLSIWETIVREVGQLIIGLDALEVLSETEEVWVGSTPDSGDSDSDSDSNSG